MKAFWWFEENAIAGMARPGFNSTRWFEFPFEEAVLLGWLGQHASSSTPLSAFHHHVQTYGSKIQKYYQISPESALQALQNLQVRPGLLNALKRLSENSHLLEGYEVTENSLHFQFSQDRLNWEIEYLKAQGIEKVVSLTENHHNKDTLEEHFDAFHFSINDLDAPKLEQVHHFAEIIRKAKKDQEKLAVHCLAGIGRTSTMLISAHLVLGEKLENLKTLIARQNPAFVLSGKQAEFIQSVSERVES